MTNEDNTQSGSISWFPYVLVVTAIMVIGVVVLSMNGSKKPNKPAEQAQQEKQQAPQRVLADTSEADYKIVSDGQTKESKVKLPYTNNYAVKGGEVFTFNFKVNYKKGASTKYNFIVDDCGEKLTVNGKEITLAKDLRGRCDYINGFVIDLKDYLKEGANDVMLEGKNSGGPSGLGVYVK